MSKSTTSIQKIVQPVATKSTIPSHFEPIVHLLIFKSQILSWVGSVIWGLFYKPSYLYSTNYFLLNTYLKKGRILLSYS